MGASWTVVVSDHEYADLEIEAGVLSALDAPVRLLAAQCRSERELAAVAADADAVLNQYCPIGAETLAVLRRCRVISRYGVGYDTVDVAAATACGICVTNVPDYCVDEVSDHALALLLASARRVAALDAQVRRGLWDYKRGQPMGRLRGKVLGLIGFGRMARALAAKVVPLQLRVLAHDPLVPPETMIHAGVEPAALDDLARAADFVSVHAPLSPATRGLVGAGLLSLMKPTAVLINTARGPVVDEDALVAALRAGRIGGAALDVLEREPPAPDHPLLAMPQVIFTPHVAWYSEESEAELRRRAAEHVALVLRGERPPHLVNPEVWGRGARG